MAQLIDIVKVEVGPRVLTATVRIADDAPLLTSDDLEGTTRVYRLMPGIIDHLCLGDKGDTFRDVMGNTELAHLLEHVTVELLAQSDLAGDISSGRTRAVGDDGRTYEVELACPDDVLVCGALSSACWMLDWAYSGGEGPEPDVEATVAGLVGLVRSLPESKAAAPASSSVAPVSAMQATGPMLQLVDEDAAEEVRVTGAEGDRGGGVASRATADVVTGSGVPVTHAPGEASAHSPEALQAAADLPMDGSGAGIAARANRGSAPSVTADLPASTSLRR